MMGSTRQLVVAAMSGGVDSSVAAAIARRRGLEVVGVTLRMWSCDVDPGGPAPAGRGCCTDADLEAAAGVAERLGIEHHVLDARAEFMDKVVLPARDAQAAGLTPNPCVLCNERIKFGLLLEWARARGASGVVSGHHARVRDGELLAGAEPAKDQSYFLFALAGDPRLRRIDFPVGGMAKGEVRKLARRLGLGVEGRSESQDLCFPAAALHEGAGDLVGLDGRVLGRHGGLSRYTIGQRKRLGVGGRGRLYVVEKRAATNEVVLGGERALLRSEVRARRVSWVGGREMDAVVKIRYRQEPAAARVRVEGSEIAAAFAVPQRAVTPGQALVCYDGERVLGGGWILG